ncbi:MAG: amidohydrolase [Desulfobacterales bacterium]|nr:amidohydrolase [Desulfobacterales bacterium]
MLHTKLPAINDTEGSFVPAGLPPVIDAHVHVFPEAIFSAVWQWFEKHGWSIRYQLSTEQVLDFLLSRGVSHIVALQYAHKPGIARELNRYMAEKTSLYPDRITGLATVFPGEDAAGQILEEAFEAGLGGVKLHAHVQCFDMNAEYMNPLYECCRQNQKPLVVHAGREPKSPAYPCDPHELCRADKLERVLRDFPDLRICVPHLGFDEIRAYRDLTEKYDNLWLDTAMVLADYFPGQESIDLRDYRIDRVIYGTDFPNIPYAWDREIKRLKTAGLTHDRLQRLFTKNAADFFAIK